MSALRMKLLHDSLHGGTNIKMSKLNTESECGSQLHVWMKYFSITLYQYVAMCMFTLPLLILAKEQKPLNTISE